MTVEAAASVLDVKPGELAPFSAADTFNGDAILAGFLCRRSDHRYGALLILSVDGRETAPQLIYATPKLHYPFGRTDAEERRYHWPDRVQRLEAYEKLDGTNVCAYSYQDADGQRRVTFKTRLTAVLSASRFGDFASLWREILKRHPDLEAPPEVLDGSLSLSFELYGYRNPHSIAYPVALETRLLFGVLQSDASPLPASSVGGRLACAPYALKPEHAFINPRDLTGFYEQLRAEADTRNTRKDEDTYEGTEGYVFYVQTTDKKWSLWKLKPESIEALHWAGDYLPDSVILPTTWNALESCEGELTAEYVATLLREEFTQTQVGASFPSIEKCVARVRERLDWRTLVGTAYRDIGLNYEAGKGPVMRALSQRFEKPQMRDVFTALLELGIAS